MTTPYDESTAGLDDIAFGPVDLGFLDELPQAEPEPEPDPDPEPEAGAEAPQVSLAKEQQSGAAEPGTATVAAAEVAAADEPADAASDTASDTAAAADADREADQPTSRSTASRPTAGRSRLALAALALVAALGALDIGLGVWLGFRLTGASSPAASSADAGGGPSARTAALTAARDSAAAFLTYDYHDLAADQRRIDALLTPTFRQAYDAAFTRDVVTNYAADKVVATAVVRDAAMTSISADTATVLVFVDQKVTDVQHQGNQARVVQNRLRLTMQLQSGRWFLGKVEQL